MSYVPSKETLKELGFFFPYTGDAFHDEHVHLSFRREKETFDILTVPVYPKSDEELRLLISMMTP